MRALVTGCGGFIGSHLTDALLDRGADVVGVDCFTGNYARARKLANLASARDWNGFRLAELDLAVDPLEHLVRECDVVFHLAGEPGVRAAATRGLATYDRNNVTATSRLLAAVRGSGARRFVHASSSSVYGPLAALPTDEAQIPRPASHYAITKLHGERLCAAYRERHGVPAVTLRYFSVYGPRQRPDMAFDVFCRAALRDEPLSVLGDGRQTRDFTFVGDVVDATMAAAARGRVGEVYNVGGGSRTTLKDAIAVLGELLDRPLEVIHQPAHDADVPHTAADISRATAELGYAPRVSLASGLTEQLDSLASASGGRISCSE